jgi:hypothetical protein
LQTFGKIKQVGNFMQHGLVHLILELLKGFMPNKGVKVEPYSEPINKELAIKVHKQWLVPTYVLLFTFIVFFAYYGGKEATKLAEYLIQMRYKDAIVINFAMVWYLIIGAIATLYFDNFLCWLVVKLKDKETLRLLNYGNQLETDYDIEAMMSLSKKLAIGLAFIVFILGGTTHLRLYNDRFVIGNPIIYDDDVYPFNQIASITHADSIHYSNGNNRNYPIIEVKMKDKRIWESNDFDIEKDSLVFKLIGQGAQVKIDSVSALYKSK